MTCTVCAWTLVGKLARWMFGSVVSGYLVGSSINSSSSSSCSSCSSSSCISSISSSSFAGRMVVWSGMACGSTLGSWGLPVVLSAWPGWYYGLQRQHCL